MQDIKANAPPVVYACLKHLWASGSKDHAFQQMKEFTRAVVERCGITSLNDIGYQVELSRGDAGKAALVNLLARCYHKLGEWQSSLQEELNDVSLSCICDGSFAL